MKLLPLRLLLPVLAAFAALPASAKLSPILGSGGNLGNSSLAFLAVDTADVASVVVDLSYFYTDAVAAGGSFDAPGTTIQWNFNANSLTVNGVAKAGTYNWSTPYAAFSAAAPSANTQWAVIGGAAGSYPNFYVTTGNPTTAQLGVQTTDLTTNLASVDAFYGKSNNVVSGGGKTSTQALTGFGANAVLGSNLSQDGYVASGAAFGSGGNWQGNLRWSAMRPVGAANTSGFWALEDDLDGATKLAGVFTFNAGILTYTTAPVPEAEAGLLAAAGLSVLWFARRRRLQG